MQCYISALNHFEEWVLLTDADTKAFAEVIYLKYQGVVLFCFVFL